MGEVSQSQIFTDIFSQFLTEFTFIWAFVHHFMIPWQYAPKTCEGKSNNFGKHSILM